MYSFVRRAGGENKKRMIIVEDRVEMFTSYGGANIARRLTSFSKRRQLKLRKL
jgi:hypothetical protein